jgi:hypothetical protein
MISPEPTNSGIYVYRNSYGNSHGVLVLDPERGRPKMSVTRQPPNRNHRHLLTEFAKP